MFLFFNENAKIKVRVLIKFYFFAENTLTKDNIEKYYDDSIPSIWLMKEWNSLDFQVWYQLLKKYI